MSPHPHLMGFLINKFTKLPALHPHDVTAGRCAEKGRKLLDSYEGMWEALK